MTQPHFYTSDLHLGHGNIIKYCGRPFNTVDEMNTALIRNWNLKVPENGKVYVVGDVLFGQQYLPLLNSLNGEKILVLGNHDEESQLRPYFSRVFRLVSFTDPSIKRKMCLCHYPIESWPGMHKDVIHLHGHCHGSLDHKMKNRMDVGVDCHPKFEPFSSEEVLQVLRRS